MKRVVDGSGHHAEKKKKEDIKGPKERGRKEKTGREGKRLI